MSETTVDTGAIRVAIATKVREARRRAGLSQAQLATLASVGISCVRNAEGTGRYFPEPENLTRIANALDNPSLADTAEPCHAERHEARVRKGRERGRANAGKHADHDALDAARRALRPDSNPREVAAKVGVCEGTVRRWIVAEFGADSTAWRERAAASLRTTHIRNANPARSRLTARRVALGLTIAQLSERVGIDTSRLCALETGYVSPRTVEPEGWRPVAVAVADYLWTTCEDLWPQHIPEDPRLPRPEYPSRPDELYDAAETRAVLADAIAKLAPVQAKVIAMRFGLNGSDEDGALLSIIGESIGLSIERTRQIEIQALAMLAKMLRREGLHV